MVTPLHKFRVEQGLTMTGLAKRLGKSRPTTHRWETGERKIGVDSLDLVSERTGIPKRDLRPDLAKKLEDSQ